MKPYCIKVDIDWDDEKWTVWVANLFDNYIEITRRTDYGEGCKQYNIPNNWYRHYRDHPN